MSDRVDSLFLEEGDHDVDVQLECDDSLGDTDSIKTCNFQSDFREGTYTNDVTQ